MGRIHTFFDYPEAVAIRRLLEEKGIPVEIRSYDDPDDDDMLSPGSGMGEVVVPLECEWTAQMILDELPLE